MCLKLDKPSTLCKSRFAMFKLKPQQILEIREARRQGATITALADQYDVLPSTISYHTRGIAPWEDGQKITWVSLEQLQEWLPALPWEGVPLPRWLVRAAKLDWKSIRHGLAGVTERTDSDQMRIGPSRGGRFDRANDDHKLPSNTRMFGFAIVDGRRVPNQAEAGALVEAARIALKKDLADYPDIIIGEEKR